MANEKRLIYSDSLFEEASKAEFMGFRAEERKQNFLDLISAMLANCPTVDAEPVIHGYWVKHNFLGHEQYACSQCQTLGSPQWKRCPVCEAKMDGGNEDG